MRTENKSILNKNQAESVQKLCTITKVQSLQKKKYQNLFDTFKHFNIHNPYGSKRRYKIPFKNKEDYQAYRDDKREWHEEQKRLRLEVERDDFATLQILNLLIGFSAKYKVVYPSQTRIGKLLGFCRKTVNEAIKKLKFLGLIKVIQRSIPRQKKYLTNFYVINHEFFDPFVMRSLYPILRSLHHFMKKVTQYFNVYNLFILNSVNKSKETSFLEVITSPLHEVDPPPEQIISKEQKKASEEQKSGDIPLWCRYEVAQQLLKRPEHTIEKPTITQQRSALQRSGGFKSLGTILG